MKSKLTNALRTLKTRVLPERLPDRLAAQIRADRAGLPKEDRGREAILQSSVAWLCRAQDSSASADGGVARDFSLRSGWATSYPETTGYIVPTLLEIASANGHQELRRRAEKMLRWLCSIQMPSGAIQGGKVDSAPVVPVPFNTGQVLLGFAAGEKAFGTLQAPMRKAADWLLAAQDPDGSWSKFYSPFAIPGAKAYDAHIAWGLIEADRVDPGRGYGEAAIANIRWCLSNQRANGWFDRCCLSNFDQPLTHTLGYALRGIVEAYRYSGDANFLQAAQRTADGLLSAMRQDGYLPGQLTSEWLPAADWACLTGAAQIAHCWLLLHQATGNNRYKDAGLAANRYVRKTIALDGPRDTRGAVRGSFPIDGAYCQYAYPNWAAKFLVDSLQLEIQLR